MRVGAKTSSYTQEQIENYRKFAVEQSIPYSQAELEAFKLEADFRVGKLTLINPYKVQQTVDAAYREGAHYSRRRAFRALEIANRVVKKLRWWRRAAWALAVVNVLVVVVSFMV